MPDDIVGGSPSIARLRSLLPELARQGSPVVITGAPGTGKTLFARHLHARRTTGFEPKSLNFAVLPERDQRVGLLGGGPPELTTTRRSVLEFPTTVILKHVDAAPTYLQESLARVLERMEVTRPGSSGGRPVAARIVLTFRAPLRALLSQGLLSRKLYEALSPSRKISLPPLRERTEDIPLLVAYFLKRFAGRGMVPDGGILQPGRLACRAWGENVRELKIYVRSLLIFPGACGNFQAERFEVTRMLGMLEDGEEFHLRDILSRIEVSMVLRAVEQCGGNMAKAAFLLGLSDRAVRRLVAGKNACLLRSRAFDLLRQA
jgi:two-component system response regulator HydG